MGMQSKSGSGAMQGGLSGAASGAMMGMAGGPMGMAGAALIGGLVGSTAGCLGGLAGGSQGAAGGASVATMMGMAAQKMGGEKMKSMLGDLFNTEGPPSPPVSGIVDSGQYNLTTPATASPFEQSGLFSLLKGPPDPNELLKSLNFRL